MRTFSALFLPVLLAFAFFGYAGAQITTTPTPNPSPTATPEPKAKPCPQVRVQPQAARMIREGQTIAFVATITGADPKIQPTIVWSTSAGAINEGQGTRRITVDTTGAGITPEREVKADLWVSGYAPECLLQATGAVKVIPPARKFGEFGELPAETVTFHLKTLAEYLGQITDSLYIIGYAGRKSERGFALNSLRSLRSELIAAGVEPRRINAFDGGFHEDPLFDFWIVPPGAEPPRPQPTVDRKEIVYPRSTPTKRP